MTLATTAPTDSSPRCPVCGWAWRDEPPRFDEEGSTACPSPVCGVSLRTDADGGLRSSTFRLAKQFSLCVLPFTFEGGIESNAVPRLESSGRWKRRVYLQDNLDDRDRTEYFLPYVRRFLFPEIEPPSPDASAQPPSCRRYEFDLSLLGAPPGHPLRLVLRGRDSRKDLAFDGLLDLEAPELILFGNHAGFLVLPFLCADPEATYFDQMTALSLLRPIAPLYRGFEMPSLAPPANVGYQMAQLLAFLLAEFQGDQVPLPPWRTDPAEKPPVKLVYDDRMLVYSFSGIDPATRLDNPARCRDLIRQHAVVTPDPTPAPERDHESRNEDAWLRSRWRGCSKDGGSLVAFTVDHYHEHFLGLYHRTYYFDVFLLAALQRVTLLSLFERLSDISTLTTGGRRGRARLRRVRKDLLRFKNQCWFSQIANHERGLVLWRQWQEVFEVHTLHNEVNDQSEELDSYLQSRYRERMEWLLRGAGFLATAVPALFGLEAILGKWEWIDTLRWVLLIALAIGSAFFVWYILYRQEEDGI